MASLGTTSLGSIPKDSGVIGAAAGATGATGAAGPTGPTGPTGVSHTCLTCGVSFQTGETQRAHFRSQWHLYNLRRKNAGLHVETLESWSRKLELLALVSQKQKRVIKKEEKKVRSPKQGTCFGDKSSTNLKGIEQGVGNQRGKYDTRFCLFDNLVFESLDDNLKHMKESHSFVLPNSQYCKSVTKLVKYLGDRIFDGHLCLACNLTFSTVEGCRLHMVDKGHTLIGTTYAKTTDDGDEYARFYDFRNSWKELNPAPGHLAIKAAEEPLTQTDVQTEVQTEPQTEPQTDAQNDDSYSDAWEDEESKDGEDAKDGEDGKDNGNDDYSVWEQQWKALGLQQGRVLLKERLLYTPTGRTVGGRAVVHGRNGVTAYPRPSTEPLPEAQSRIVLRRHPEFPVATNTPAQKTARQQQRKQFQHQNLRQGMIQNKFVLIKVPQTSIWG